jgi:hypothetical protein
VLCVRSPSCAIPCRDPCLASFSQTMPASPLRCPLPASAAAPRPADASPGHRQPQASAPAPVHTPAAVAVDADASEDADSVAGPAAAPRRRRRGKKPTVGLSTDLPVGMVRCVCMGNCFVVELCHHLLRRGTFVIAGGGSPSSPCAHRLGRLTCAFCRCCHVCAAAFRVGNGSGSGITAALVRVGGPLLATRSSPGIWFESSWNAMIKGDERVGVCDCVLCVSSAHVVIVIPVPALFARWSRTAAAAAASTAHGAHSWAKKPTGSTATVSAPTSASGTATAAVAATVATAPVAAAMPVIAAARPVLLVPPSLPPWLDLPLLSQHVLTGTLSRFCRAAVGQQQVCVCERERGIV